MWQVKQPLPVRDGELGLRQSDAVFFHTRQLPEVLERLREDLGGRPMLLDGVAASDRPRQAEGSYMPCFLAGTGSARALAAVTGAPLYRFSHQQGHVAAALYGDVYKRQLLYHAQLTRLDHPAYPSGDQPVADPQTMASQNGSDELSLIHISRPWRGP